MERCIYGPAQPVVDTVGQGKVLLKLEREAEVVNIFMYIFLKNMK